MISFPNAKINIGLNILGKRPDGFHDISSCFYPVGICDALEVIPAEIDSFRTSGQNIEANEVNLVTRARDLLAKDFPIPPLSVYLLKSIPIGAGLGGGSSDAAFMIRMLSELLGLPLSVDQQEAYAQQLGSDCAFFIRNKPMYCFGKGDQCGPVGISLRGFSVVIVNPGIHISTAEAYADVSPTLPERHLKDLLMTPISDWKNSIKNDFETSVFLKYPSIAGLKDDLYKMGAIYASMSGSGSSVYGIFENMPKIDNKFRDCFVWQGELN